MVTVHIVSWVGSVLHGVPNGVGSGYAVFTFRTDQNKPMSTNILMNILFPNVCYIFIYMHCYYSHVNCKLEDVFSFIIFYYLYRMFLICFILNRRELFNKRYEFFSTVAGILVAYVLTELFLSNPESVFIDTKELVNEFWLLVILIMYRFFVLLLDNTFTQKNVVNPKMLDKYIYNRFNFFYKKYEHLTSISKEDRHIWIMLFSIMIFENFNRGSIKRRLEWFKIVLGKSATVGIMQIKSNENLADEESIILAYDKLANEIMADSIGCADDYYDDMTNEYYAYQYNPDEDYSKSVSYIFQRLFDYIKRHPRYSKLFYLNKQTNGEGDECELCTRTGENETDLLAASSESMETQCTCEQEQYWTLGDVAQISGLSRKQVMKIIKKTGVIMLLQDREVHKYFDKYMPKG